MLLGIDHIVIACRDPDAAAELLRAEVGLEPGGGGRHERNGTFNRLVWLGDSYLELMGVFDAGLAGQRSIGASALAILQAGTEGFASFAIATDDIRSDVAALQALGSSLEPPADGQRVRPDGDVVRWQTAISPTVGLGGLPFLIEHEYVGSEWGEPARAARAEQVHPFGGRATLARLELAARDPKLAAARHHREIGLATVAAADRSIDLPIGPQLLRLNRPRTGRPHVIIAIDGTAGSPRSVDLLGCRFLVEVA
jgi:catechol 2,3-dioxygenase-like lactoylglutathione lyase family enzyme